VPEKTRESLEKQIEKSKKEVTILFTDIERSTEFWDTHGDTAGRLMLDLHNKLMFPVIRRLRGTVTKTIGDSIMASFKSPEDALRAAIGMQQILTRHKEEHEDLDIKIRIGMHTGQAIVEKGDVYGDVVNVASRIEKMGRGGEILITSATSRGLKGKKRKYHLTKRDTIVPKGKQRAISVYACDWKKHRSLIDRIQIKKHLPVSRRQKFELVLYSLVALVSVFILYARYVRYLLADFEFVALRMLNPHPLIPLALLVGLLVLAVLLLRRKTRWGPLLPLKFLKGGYGFGLGIGLGLLTVFILTDLVKTDLGYPWDGVLHESDHLFVEVLEDDVGIHEFPRRNSDVLLEADKGTLLLQTELIQKRRLAWTKVLLKRKDQSYGFVLRQTPPRVGVESRRLTRSDKFYFRFYDVYALILGLAGFFWGFFSFRVRPI
jgi:class 3 adenylate cyclase